MKKLGLLLLLITVLFAFACAPAEEPASETTEPAPEPVAEEVAPEPPTAMVTLLNAEGEEVGTATFVEGEGGVTLKAIVNGAPTGKHGFHIHEFGECAPDFTAAGGHFNPMGTPHGCPDDPNRHAGDFGNIEISEGGGMLEVVSDLITVSPGPTSIVGKAVIIHAGEDMCPEQPTGAAGARFACGVIHLAGDEAAMAEGHGADAEPAAH